MIEYEDLARSNLPLQAELEQAAARVIRSGWYILGKEVAAFEEAFAACIGTKHCVGVGNGLDALTLSIEALDLARGSDVLVASNTYIATIVAIIRAGHRPILVEPDIATYNIDPGRLADALTPATRAICVTHLYGKTCRMDSIGAFARERGLRVVEDCAQSHGARLGSRMTGTFGDDGCFRFYPTKNLGALGDAGAVVTDADDLADRLRHLRNYGSKKKYYNEVKGYNSRLDEIQAALLRVKLKKLDEWNARRGVIARRYLAAMPNSALTLPFVPSWAEPVWHLFVVRHPKRDTFQQKLNEAGIGTLIHYPVPPHLSGAYADAGWKRGAFPLAENFADSVLSLPIGPHLPVDQAAQVEQETKRAVNTFQS